MLGSWDINNANAVPDRRERILLSGPNIDGVISLMAQSSSDRDIWVEVINCAAVGDFEGAIKAGLCSTMKPVEEEYVVVRPSNQKKMPRKSSESSLESSEYDVIDDEEFMIVNTDKCYDDVVEVDSTGSMTPCETSEGSQWMNVDSDLQVECIEGIQLLPITQTSTESQSTSRTVSNKSLNETENEPKINEEIQSTSNSIISPVIGDHHTLNHDIITNNEQFFTLDRIIESNIDLNTNIMSCDDTTPVPELSDTTNYEIETTTIDEPENNTITPVEVQQDTSIDQNEEPTPHTPLTPLNITASTDSLSEKPLISEVALNLLRQDSYTQTNTLSPPASPLQLHDNHPLFGVLPPKKPTKPNNSKIRIYRYLQVTLKAFFSLLFISIFVYLLSVCSFYVSMSIMILLFTPIYYYRSCEGRKRATRKRPAPAHSSTGTGPIGTQIKLPSTRPGSPRHKQLEQSQSQAINTMQHRIVPSLRGQASPR